MYEGKDFESILENMCARVSEGIGTGEGTLVNFALAPAAAALEEVYHDLAVTELNSSALTCDREHLIMFGNENNIPVKTATRAIWIAEFNVDFEIGERFESGDLTYISTGKIEEKKYFLECETEGTAGNIKQEDELLPIEFIEGYEKGELKQLAEPAVDDEETEAYRSRYLAERKQKYTTGGNREDYKKNIKALPGVGGVKQERVTKEYKRIKTYILSELWGKPDDDVIEAVQQAIDPKDSQGDGEGKAPFWHVVDIYPVNTLEIHVSGKFELLGGTTFETVRQDIETAIENYFTELNKTWEDTGKDGLIVRILKMAEAMTAVEGVVDIRDLSLNGIADNIVLDKYTIPVKGEIENVN